MQIQVHYDGVESTPWMDEFITNRVSKLNRYLNPAATITIHVKAQNPFHYTTISVHNMNHDYAFNAQGDNLYESFQLATNKAARALSEQKRILKDRIHRRNNVMSIRATA